MNKVLCVVLAAVLLAGCSKESEPKIDRQIEVVVYESMASKASGYYAPQIYRAFSHLMLFDCPSSEVNRQEFKEVAQGVLVLNNGSRVRAKYSSDAGVLYDVPYGSYTMVVHCLPNPLNGYLDNRCMLRQYEYSEANSVDRLECCFVWEDMQVGGGWYEWEVK